MTENHLLQALSKGDHQAFELLFKKYFKSLFLHVQPILISHDNCQEAVQNTFLKLWEKRSQLKITGSLQAYLRKMAFNEALMLRRAQKSFANPDQLDLTELDTRLEHVIEHKQQFTQLEACIQSLPEKIQETFTLYRKEGLTQVEISDYLGKAKKTIEAQLSRALVLLRSCLGLEKNKK